MDLLKPIMIFLSLGLLSIFASTSVAATKPAKKNSPAVASQKAKPAPNRSTANADSEDESETSAPATTVAANSNSSSAGSTAEANRGGATNATNLDTAKADSRAIPKRGPIVGSSDSSTNLFENEKGFLAGLDYPELQVVPRASERLNIELQLEKSSMLGHYWPVQTAAIGLIVAGLSSSGKYKQTVPTDAQKKEHQFSTQLGIITGSLWIAATYMLEHPSTYSQSQGEIKKITGKDKKSLLLKERLAEEALERPAKMAQLINTMAVWSNLVLSLYINEHSKQGTVNYAALAAGLAFIPWVFENRLISNWEKHLEYKRKIYAPITMIDLQIDPKSGKATPLLGFQWQF